MMPLPLSMISRRSGVATAVIGFLLATASTAVAQAPRDFHSGIETGIGFSGVLPDAMAGVGAWRLFPGLGFGVFVDAQITPTDIRGESTYCPARVSPPNTPVCTVGAVEDDSGLALNYRHPILDGDEFLILNAGGVLPLTGEFALMLGAGMARHHAYREFTEIPTELEEFQVSPTGAYFAPFTARPEWTLQGVAGMLFRAGDHFVARFGYSTATSGLGVGLYVAF